MDWKCSPARAAQPGGPLGAKWSSPEDVPSLREDCGTGGETYRNGTRRR